MFNIIKNSFKTLDISVKIIMKHGLKFCSVLGFVALMILITYNFSIKASFLYNIGFILFKLSLIFGVEFIICGFAIDKIKNGA